MRILCGSFVLSLTALLAAAGAQSPGSKSGDDEPTSLGGKTIAEWRKDLTHPDPSRRSQAIVAITGFGDNATMKCVPDLIARLDDKDVSPRTKAILALRVIAIEEKDVRRVVDALAKRLQPQWETQAIVRIEALGTLRRFIPDGAPAVPALINATVDTSSWEIRHGSIALLWRIGYETIADKEAGPDPKIYEALLASLRNGKSFQEKLETIQGLGALGRPGNPSLLNRVINDLTLCTNTRNQENRPLTIWAYAGLIAMQEGDQATTSLNLLAKHLKDNQLEMRVQAALALGATKTKAKAKVALLVEMLKDKEPMAVQAACGALGQIGETNLTVVDPIIDLLTHKNEGIVVSAIASLVQLKQNNGRVHAIFDKMLGQKDLDLGVRAVVEAAVKELKKPPAEKKKKP